MAMTGRLTGDARANPDRDPGSIILQKSPDPNQGSQEPGVNVRLDSLSK